MGGHAVKNARIEAGSATSLSLVSAAKFKVDADAGAPTQPPLGFERFALFGQHGVVTAREEIYYYNDTLHVQHLSGHAMAGDARGQRRGVPLI